MSDSEVREFASLLSEMRSRLIDGARRLREGEVHIDPDQASDEIDTAASESGLAFAGRLRERERALLEKTEAALARIEQGTFGVCVECGDPIAAARLRARPTATLCIECKNEQERLEASQ